MPALLPPPPPPPPPQAAMQARYTRLRQSVLLGRPSLSQVLVICNISLCFSREGHFFGQRLAQTLSSMRKMQQDAFVRESRRGIKDPF